MPDTNIYVNGASFQGGALKVTDTNQVTNLNAEKLQGETPASFIKTARAASGASGITQTSGMLTFYNEEAVFSGSNSKIKIGNLIIKASPDGNSILIGIE